MSTCRCPWTSRRPVACMRSKWRPAVALEVASEPWRRNSSFQEVKARKKALGLLPPERKRLDRKNLSKVVRKYFRGTDGKPIELAPFHLELLEMMFKGGKYVVNWPTDHG